MNVEAAAGPTADVWFTTGASHVVGQDYAVAGRGEAGAAVVVSDGCSSSPDTDIGARIVARGALAGLVGTGDFDADRVLAGAAQGAAGLHLPLPSLDATVVWALARPGGAVEVGVCGDGTVAARRRDGVVLVWSVEHPCCAPRYPSYRLDPARARAYEERFGESVVVHHRDRDQRWSSVRFAGECFGLTLEADAFDLVLVGSDGLSSFVGPAAGGRGPVGVESVIDRLVAVPHARGRFLARRCRRMWSRELPARRWSHHDDVGVGALALPPERSRP